MMLSVCRHAWASVICQRHFTLVGFLDLLLCFHEQKYLSCLSSIREYPVTASPGKLSTPRWQTGHQPSEFSGVPANSLYLHSNTTSSGLHHTPLCPQHGTSISTIKMLRAAILARISLKDPSLVLTHLEHISFLSSYC